MKKRWLLGGIALLLLAGAGIAVKLGVVAVPGMNNNANANAKDQAGANKDGKKEDPPLEFLQREVVQPSMARMETGIEFSGPLVAPQTATVRAKTSGTLLALSVQEGSRVAAGQVLGRIEMAELGSRMAERDASVEGARATLAQAERTHATNERLAAQQFISSTALDASRAALDTAKANVSAAEAARGTTKLAQRDAALVAPISGIVAKRMALPGEKLSTEQQVLTIVDLSKLELAGTVGTHEVARIATGLPVQVQVEGVAQPVAGRLARIAPAAEPGTRSIGVTIELANPTEQLRAGQYAMARAALADDTLRLTLPASAVGKTSGQDHIWVIEGGVLARRAVTVGRRDERTGRVEILQGATPQSVVLGARFDNLKEGGKAVVVAAKAPVAAAASGSVSAPAVAASAPSLTQK
jgi:membrane fusion protein, multidrug efflux system